MPLICTVGQLRRYSDACIDGVRHRAGHSVIALELCRFRTVVALRDDAGDKVGDGSADHSGFSQGRQYLVYVVQECAAGAHYEHSGSFECAAVRIQQIGGAMQGNGRFPGSGSSLYDDGPAHGGADDAVLFGLNGGDDVGHLAGAFGTQRREQGTFTGQCSGLRSLGDLGCLEIEHFVLKADDGAKVQGDVCLRITMSPWFDGVAS
jgi:hypothetical protein